MGYLISVFWICGWLFCVGAMKQAPGLLDSRPREAAYAAISVLFWPLMLGKLWMAK